MGQEKNCMLSVLSGLSLERIYGLSPETKRTIRNNRVSVLSRCL